MDSEAPRCLVTGGAGFIGSHLVEALVRRGYQTTVLDNQSTGTRRELPTGVRLVDGDIRDPEAVDRAVAQADYVFHLAAYISASGSMDEPRECFETNTLGLLNVLKSSGAHRTRKLIFASSCAVYRSGGASARREQDRPAPGSPYAVSKLDGEYLLAVNHGASGIPYVALRYFNVYGPGQPPGGQYAAVIPAFIQTALAGGDLHIFGDGAQTRDFVFVEDVAQATVRAMEAGLGVYNVGTGRSVTIRGLAHAVTELSGSRAETVLDAPRPGEVRHSLANVLKARRELGWEASWSLEEGLKETIRWFRS